MSEQWQTRITLLQKLQQNQDEKAWEEFVIYYSSFIKMVLIRLGVKDPDLDDILQNILLSAWQYLSTYCYLEGQVKFRTWLSKIIKNKAISFFRKQATHNRRLAEAKEQVSAKMPEIEKIAEMEWKRYISQLAWQNIQSKFTTEVLEVFESAMRGKSNQQIANEKSMKENSVAVYKKRFRQALHHEILRLDHELNC